MYVDASGWYPKNRWQKIDFNWYFFDREGHMLKDAYQKGASGKIWYLGKNGIQSDPVKYRHKDSGGWWYGVKGGWYAKDAAYIIDGVARTFDRDGYCTNP